MPLIICWRKYSTGERPSHKDARQASRPIGVITTDAAKRHMQHPRALASAGGLPRKAAPDGVESSEQPPHLAPHGGEHIALEPGIGRQPGIVAPGWMRQGDTPRPVGEASSRRVATLLRFRSCCRRCGAPDASAGRSCRPAGQARAAAWRRTGARARLGAHSRRGGRSPPAASWPGKQKPMGTMAMRRWS